jgi:hypothetical protein
MFGALDAPYSQLSPPISLILDEEHFSSPSCDASLHPPPAAWRSFWQGPQAYALVEKLKLLDESTRLQRDCNLSLRRAAEVIGVPVQVLSRWQKEVPTIHPAIEDQPQTRNRKAILDGPNGTLGSVEMDLLQFVFGKCEQGVNVRHTIVACKALSLLRDTFGDKSFNAKLKAVSCFMWKHNFVYRRATHHATRAFAKVSAEAMAFLDEVCPIVVGPHRDNRYIFNMDQTPLFFSYESLTTLEKRGTRTIFVRNVIFIKK